MARFADVTGGSVKIDGVDVRDYDLNALRAKIGYAMQDVFLFSNTIDANIAYGNPDMEERDVYKYAKWRMRTDLSSACRRGMTPS